MMMMMVMMMMMMMMKGLAIDTTFDTGTTYSKGLAIGTRWCGVTVGNLGRGSNRARPLSDAGA
jgi:hypothetical protein